MRLHVIALSGSFLVLALAMPVQGIGTLPLEFPAEASPCYDVEFGDGDVQGDPLGSEDKFIPLAPIGGGGGPIGPGGAELEVGDWWGIWLIHDATGTCMDDVMDTLGVGAKGTVVDPGCYDVEFGTGDPQADPGSEDKFIPLVPTGPTGGLIWQVDDGEGDWYGIWIIYDASGTCIPVGVGPDGAASPVPADVLGDPIAL